VLPLVFVSWQMAALFVSVEYIWPVGGLVPARFAPTP
jgi:hypothetical protein